MPVTAADLKIVLRGSFLGQEVEVVQWYRPLGAAFLTATPEGVGEAYWNDIKTAWRACHVASSEDTTTSIFVSEPGAGGAYGEYAVPAGEQSGTRSATGLGDFMPPYVTVAMRQTVATRTTRPGQKRFWGALEGDNTNGALQAALKALVETLAAKFDSTITLGSPVATGTLDPEIVRLAGVPATVTARQDVAGHLVAAQLSTQNSRKKGRGA